MSQIGIIIIPMQDWQNRKESKEIYMKLFNLLGVLCSISICCSMTACQPSTSSNSSDSISMSESSSVVTTEKGESKKVYAKTFEYIGGRDVMPIGTFHGPDTTILNDEYFSLIQDCGIKFFTSTLDGSIDRENTNKLLEICDRYNIGAFIGLSAITSPARMGTAFTSEQYDKLLSMFLDYDSLLGVHIADEPNYTQCANLSESVKAIQQSDIGSEYDVYFNALPMYAENASLAGSSVDASKEANFEIYMRQYIEKLEVDYFSYDFYPFGKFGYINPDYFKNMGIVRNICDEYNIPFWTFIQCGASFENPISECIPDEDYFRWNIATCLAYGAKGMQYFTLQQPISFVDATDSETYTRCGLFGADGRINQWYYYAKENNAHIAEIDSVLMNAYHEGVIFSGKSVIAQSTGKEVISSGSFKELTSVSGDALVGCFDYKGGTCLYVVNNTPLKMNEVTLNFDNNYLYTITRGTDSVTQTGKILTLSLNKGEGALVVLK